MANGAFDATLDVNNEIKVNNFDWSHANNLTTLNLHGSYLQNLDSHPKEHEEDI